MQYYSTSKYVVPTYDFINDFQYGDIKDLKDDSWKLGPVLI